MRLAAIVMEIPISCERCPLLDWDLDYIKCKATDRHFSMAECWRSNRVPDCPLVPAADVRPVVSGKWTDHRTIEHDGNWYCSACGKEITIYMGPDRPDRYRFCPNCGADMREGEK